MLYYTYCGWFVGISWGLYKVSIWIVEAHGRSLENNNDREFKNQSPLSLREGLCLHITCIDEETVLCRNYNLPRLDNE